jgi:hypothetical protein
MFRLRDIRRFGLPCGKKQRHFRLRGREKAPELQMMINSWPFTMRFLAPVLRQRQRPRRNSAPVSRFPMKKIILAATAILASGAANAAVTFNSAPFDAALASGEQLKVTFDAPNAPGWVFSGNGQVFSASAANAAAPAGNATKFMAVLGGKSAVLSTPLIGSMSVYIGSVDTYNSIIFKGLNGFSQSFSGAQLVATANGNQSSAGTNRRFYFDFGNAKVNEITFNSGSNSFEFDNIAAGAAVPEPATWAMLIAGFGLVGVSMRRRNRNAVTTATA